MSSFLAHLSISDIESDKKWEILLLSASSWLLSRPPLCDLDSRLIMQRNYVTVSNKEAKRKRQRSCDPPSQLIRVCPHLGFIWKRPMGTDRKASLASSRPHPLLLSLANLSP